MQSYLNRFAPAKRSWMPDPDPDDEELTAKRRKNDERHASRWSSIIDRYSRDFTELGDEIDLRTGRIVTDNGHIRRMRDELDNGTQENRQVRRAQSVLHDVMRYDEADSLEEEDPEDLGGDDEDDEDDEDELNSDWPAPPSSAQKEQSVEAPIKSRSPSLEVWEDAAEDVDEEPMQQTQLDAPNQPMRSIEEVAIMSHQPSPQTPQAPVQMAPMVVQPMMPLMSHFQMQQPQQLAQPGSLDTMMQAMSAAMGTAIQAQMMALLNVMMANQHSATTQMVPSPVNPIHGANVHSATAAVDSRQPILQPVPAQGGGNQPSSFRSPSPPLPPPPISSRRPKPLHTPKTKQSAHSYADRGKTPGSESLWALPSRRSSAQRRSVTLPQHAARNRLEIAPRRTSNLKSYINAADLASSGDRVSAERDSIPSGNGESPDPISDDFPTYNGDSTTEGSFLAQDNSSGSDEDGRSEAGGDSVNASKVHVAEAGKQTRHIRGEQQRHFSGPFVVDSDEDELCAGTPTSSAKQTTGAETSSRSSRREALPRTAPEARQDLALKPVQHGTPEVETPRDAPSSSRAGLRRRKISTYNEQETFDNLFQDVMEVSTAASTRAPGRSQMIDSSDDDIDPAILDDVSESGESESDAVPGDHHEFGTPASLIQTPLPIAAPAIMYEASKLNPIANTGLPRTRPEQLPTFQRESSHVLTDEIAEQYAHWAKRRSWYIEYHQRPPPLPCAHCKATIATTWLVNPDDNKSRICNACHGWMKKYNGEKRPVSFQDIRNMKAKMPCENCGKFGVSDWSNVTFGKRLCYTCTTYTKQHGGAMKPTPPRIPQKCMRCSKSTLTVFNLSNRARVCIECHDEIFADLLAEKDSGNPADSNALDFDKCLLIFSYNILPSLDIRRRTESAKPNAKNMPCKSCHTLVSNTWRPALDKATICEICHSRTTKLMQKHGLLERLKGDDGGEADDLKISNFNCARCNQDLEPTKWRKQSPTGGIVCTSCFTPPAVRAIPQPPPAQKVLYDTRPQMTVYGAAPQVHAYIGDVTPGTGPQFGMMTPGSWFVDVVTPSTYQQSKQKWIRDETNTPNS